MRSKTALKERIEMLVVEEINVTNLIAQAEPENWVPKFVQNLTNRIHEILLDELRYGK